MTLMESLNLRSATGGTLCPRGLFEEKDYRTLQDHTELILGVIGNPVLREALQTFEHLRGPAVPYECAFAGALPPTGKWYADLDQISRQIVTIWTALDPTVVIDGLDEFQRSLSLAVGAIGYVQGALGITLKQALKAARIRPRTYHAWRENPDRNPRVTSLGRLWELRQLTEDLEETMGTLGVRSWLSRDPSRLTALLRGQFDDIAAAAYASADLGQEFPNFDGAVSEHESKPRMRRYPITGRKMSPGDVVGPHK